MVTSDKCYRNREWIHGYRETDALGGNDPYSASKGAAELVIHSYIHSFFLTADTPAIASVRAGNVIGGGDWSENRIIPDCIRSLTSNTPIDHRNPQFSTPMAACPGTAVRVSFARQCTLGQTNHFRGPWNFGPYPCNAVTVEDLVQEIIRQWGSGSYHVEESRTGKNRESDMLILDISKAIPPAALASGPFLARCTPVYSR